MVKDHEKYVRKDVYSVEVQGVKKLCDEKHKTVDLRLTHVEDRQQAIERKITATLVFTVVTLVGVVVVILTRLV